MIIINGPIRKELNINGGSNALGEGWRANATIGRFVQLMKRNIGGSYPGTTAKRLWVGRENIPSASAKMRKRARGSRSTSSAASKRIKAR